MAEKTKNTEKKKKQNSVSITGYLKENNLEKVDVKDKGEVIRGSIIIATDESSNYKVQYYVPSTTKDGEANEEFDKLSALLPDNTTSIASYLKNNPGADYAEAAANATKVWAAARFEEFVSKVEGRSKNMILIKGFRAGIKGVEDTFNPHANFSVDVFVYKLEPEIVYEDEDDEEGTETGRAILTGLLPVYDDSVYCIDFIAPKEVQVEINEEVKTIELAAFILENYSKGDTVTLKGDLVNMDKKVETETDDDDDDEFIGEQRGPQYRTIFTRERVIKGCSKRPIKQGDENCITLEAAKAGMVKRETKAIENGKRASENDKKKETPKKEVKKEFADDMDF